MREQIEARLAELREICEKTMWHEKQDAQIEVLEWVLGLTSSTFFSEWDFEGMQCGSCGKAFPKGTRPGVFFSHPCKKEEQ